MSASPYTLAQPDPQRDPWALCPLDVGGGRLAQLQYQRRAYETCIPYTSQDYQAHRLGRGVQLFEAHSVETNEVLSRTARKSSLVARVVDAYTSLVKGNGRPRPTTGDDSRDDAIEREARALMKRSKWHLWALPMLVNALVDGDSWVEPVLWDAASRDITVEVYPAEQVVDSYYEGSWQRLRWVMVCGRTADTVNTEMRYWRWMDSEQIVTGQTAGQERGAGRVSQHRLGVEPITHLRALWDQRHQYGIWVGGRVEPHQRGLDSMTAMRDAIFLDVADPKLVLVGATLDGDSTTAGHAKTLSLPMDARAEYLEMKSNTGQHINEAIRDAQEAAKQDDPALAANQAGANTSAKAWAYRTLGLTGKVDMLRANWGDAMARVLGVFRAYERGEPYDRAWVDALDFEFDDDYSTETVRALAELHRDGVFTREEVRAFASAKGILMPGFSVQGEAGDAVQAD